jgi:RNA polymerase sigma factor for flagellar operon FliA
VETIMLEPRYFTRASLDFAVAFDMTSEPPCEGRLVNISEGGALLDLPRTFDVGEVATVKIAIPGRTSWLTTEARVVRAEPSERGRASVAIMFVNLDDEDAAVIGELVGRTETMAWSSEGNRIPREVAAHYVPMIRRIARGVAYRLPPHVAVEDLVGSGFVAFVDFYGKNSHLPGDELERAAKARIRGAMLDELRGADPLTRRMRQRERSITSARKELEGKLGRAATHEEVARHMSLSPAAYASVLSASHASRVTSLDAGIEHDVADTDAVGPEGAMQETEALSSLRTAIDALPPRLRKVLELHYGEDLTLRAIGNILGVSEARISQLISDAVRRLRASVSDAPPAPVRAPRAQRRAIAA